MGKKASIVYAFMFTCLANIAMIPHYSYRADAQLGQLAESQSDSLYEKCLAILSQEASFPKQQLCSDLVNGTNILSLPPQEKQSLKCDLIERTSPAGNETIPECMPSTN
jgi:hypothetical protein